MIKPLLTFVLILKVSTIATWLLWPTHVLCQTIELGPSSQSADQPEEPAEKISATAGPEDDRAIEKRLQNIFANIEGLERIRIQVQAGVVELTGQALSAGAREQAVTLAEQVAGVVEVNEEIAEVRNLQERLTPTWKKLRGYGYDFLGYLPLLGVATLVFAVFWLLSRWVMTWNFVFTKLAGNTFLRELLRQLARVAIVLVGVALTLEILGITAPVSTALGAAGLVGIAISFALRDTVENYITSVLLTVRQPFAPNDYILVDGYEGHVVRLTSRATILLTLEGNHVRIPNANVFKGVITNYTRNPKRRFDFIVGIDTEENVASTQKLILNTLQKVTGIVDEPPSICLIEQLGDFNVLLKVMSWVDQQHADYYKVRSEAIRLVKQALDKEGVTMPEPIYNLRLNKWGPNNDVSPTETSKSITTPESGEPEVVLDVSRDTYLDRQVAVDASKGEPNLLKENALKE